MDGAAAERDISERLYSYLARRKLLLLLDNCEHVVDAAAGLADEILGRCPDVTIVTTSREALAVPDEVQVNVGPLESPPEAHTGSADPRLPGRPAVRRACSRRPARNRLRRTEPQRHRPHHQGAGRHPARGRACRGTRQRDVARSRSLIGWTTGSRSSPRDPAPQKHGSRRCGPPSTGATPCSAAASSRSSTGSRSSRAAGPWRLPKPSSPSPDAPEGFVLETIARLVERSMVVVEPGPTDSVPAAGDAASVRRRATRRNRRTRCARGPPCPPLPRPRASPQSWTCAGHGQRDALRRLRQEQPNVRAALTWLSGPDGDVDQALEMAGSLGLFWHLGRHLEGREVLQRLLELGGSEQARAHALQAVSIVERPRGCLVHPSPAVRGDRTGEPRHVRRRG